MPSLYESRSHVLRKHTEIDETGKTEILVKMRQYFAPMGELQVLNRVRIVNKVHLYLNPTMTGALLSQRFLCHDIILLIPIVKLRITVPLQMALTKDP